MYKYGCDITKSEEDIIEARLSISAAGTLPSTFSPGL